MLTILFVIGFFLMLLLTGISLLGILVAMIVATLLMFIGGAVTMVMKLFPWLLLAVIVVWLYRTFSEQPIKSRNRLP